MVGTSPDGARGPDLGVDGLVEAELIGRGGYGTVYRARQPALNRSIAVKVLASVLDGEALQRFEREAYAMGSLAGHPNIVHVLAVGSTSAGLPYLLMPYVASGSFDALPPVSWERALQYGVRLAGALATAHSAGVLHRDVKPANVLLSDFGEPLLTDFGIAHVTDGFRTASGLISASIPFAPPEVLEGGPATEASDVYSLAATLVAFITGRAPFASEPGEQLVSLYLRISRDPPPDLRAVGVPDVVCTALERSMSKAPEGRPESAAAFGRTLQEAQAAIGRPVTEMAVHGTAATAKIADAAASGGGLSEVVADEAAVGTVTEPVATAPIVTKPPDTRPRATPAKAASPEPPSSDRRGQHRRLRAAFTVLVGLALVVLATVWLWPEPDRPDDGSGPRSGNEVTSSRGVAVLPDGDVLITDQDRHRVLRASPDGHTTTFAGTGQPGASGDEGPAAEAGISSPAGIAVANDGSVYIATDGALRMVDPDGIIHSVRGLPAGFHPEVVTTWADALAVSDRKQVIRLAEGESTVLFDTGPISGIAAHPDGWLAVSSGDQILGVSLQGDRRRIVGVASGSEPRVDGQPADESAIAGPTGLAFDDAGRLYFTESGNGRVRMVDDDDVVRTVVGSPAGFSQGNGGDGGKGTDAQLTPGAGALAFGPDGDLYIADEENGRVRRLDTDGLIHAFVS